ncbi:MAG: HAD family hydrolase [Asgard group archaeon]|nr:HAD family hydrolase [Asgard group archaeon]
MSRDTITLKDIKSKRKNLKAILFDLDGTLIDSQEGIITLYYEFAKSKGYNIPRENFDKLFGTPIEKVLAKLLPDKSKDEISDYLVEIREIYSKNHLQSSCTFPNVVSMLQKIKHQGYKIGIASTKFKKFVDEAVDYFGFRPFVDVVVSGYEVKRHKPAPDLIYYCAELLNVSPKDCVYIGDSPSDIKAGKSAGTLTIAVLTGSYTRDKFVKVKPDFVINELTEIDFN